MNRKALALGLSLLLSAACGRSWTDGPPAAPKPKELTVEERMPKRENLPCFQCHDFKKFERGKFPHRKVAHRTAGHCHLCHVGGGHHDSMKIDGSPCLKCHETDSDEIKILQPEPAKAEAPAEAKPAVPAKK